MLPLKDLNRSSTTPHINRLLLAVNIIIFIVYWLASGNIVLSSSFQAEIENRFVMVPGTVLQGHDFYTLVTSMFLHASWLHLLGNMLFLYIFGDNVEDAFGHLSYLALYLFCGLLASLSDIVATAFAPNINTLFGLQLPSDLTVGVVGASGAISGVLGAYIVLYPRARIVSIVFYFIMAVPAIVFLGAWFALQLLYSVLDPYGGVAYFAHIGGFIAGALLALTIGRTRKKARESRQRL